MKHFTTSQEVKDRLEAIISELHDICAANGIPYVASCITDHDDTGADQVISTWIDGPSGLAPDSICAALEVLSLPFVPDELVKAAMLFQAKQDVRNYLNGIYITHDNIVGCDGHTLFVAPYESDLRPEQAIIIAIKGKIPPKAYNLELLYDEESKIGVICCVGPTPTATLVRSGTSWVHEECKPMAILDATGHPQKVFFDKVDGRFPDWRRAMPAGDLVPTDRIRIDFGYAERINKACKELGSEFAQCAINLRGPETSIEVELNGREYQGAKAIIMPCRL